MSPATVCSPAFPLGLAYTIITHDLFSSPQIRVSMPPESPRLWKHLQASTAWRHAIVAKDGPTLGFLFSRVESCLQSFLGNGKPAGQRA